MTEEMFGQYRLDGLLGRGGMGEVHRAFDTVRGRAVAIKRLPLRLAADEEFAARFRAESALVARLREPHIIPIHDFGEIDGRLFIDMRLVEGPNLAAMLDDIGRLDPHRAVNVVSQIAAALDVAHAEGLVHRDIKPGNVLVTPATGSDGDGEFVYVADFGIARAVSSGSTSLTATGATVGSLDYMAPERFTGGHGDHRVDVYSLGCLLYEALTASKPFTGEGLPAMINAHLNTPAPLPSEHVPGIPAGLDDVISRAMAKHPDDRYASAGALAVSARAALEGSPDAVTVPRPAAETIIPSALPGAFAAVQPVAPRPASISTGAARQRRRRGLVAVAVLATVVTLLGGAALALSLQGSPAQPTVRTEPGGAPGDNPFMPPQGKDRPGVTPPAGSGGTFPGGTSGLYGGTLNNAACDPAGMTTFLQQHPDKEAAWASVQGIPPDAVPAYIAGLTPVILRSDTAVTNHGYTQGRATVIPAVLQAGSAVLVDRYGVPRARCACGNPLTPPQQLQQPQYTGATWTGFTPAAVTTIEPTTTPITEFVLVDPATNGVFRRPAGSNGSQDRPADPSSTEPTGPPSATVAPSTDPGQIPPDPGTGTITGPVTTPVVRTPTETPTQPKADLTPTAIVFNRADLTVGTKIYFDSGVTNLGNATTPHFNIKWYVDGREVGAYGDHNGVGANTTVLDGNSQFTWAFTEPGTHTVTFTLDVDNFVAESNESNNATSATVDIAPILQVSPKPDLAPTAVTYTGALAIGSRIDFDSGITNHGSADTGVFNIKWYVDGKEVGAYGSHSGVPANTTVMNGNSQFNYTFSGAGSHKVTFTVDVDNFIAESNESNNSQSVTITIK
ncbi:DUF6777 domain-containing protein [Pseudonocardia sp. GCM10023141]|uniref:DUF6777 domain-containing protein n=1 Tax=Pseudonocardia sp. GCM10023141 TaxID=3252653 RepID=UPI00361E44F8